MSPYWGKNFFEFFGVLIERFPHWIRGDMVSDEVQLFVLMGVAISTALVGTFLVLKKMTMFANSISHTILLGIVLAYAATLSLVPEGELHLNITLLFVASLITALFTGGLTHFFIHYLKVPEDASIGLVFTTLFALGVVAVSLLTRNAHIGIEAIMGNVDALHPDDFKMIGVVLAVDLIVVILFFKELVTTSFDSLFARSCGMSIPLIQSLLMVLTSITCIGAFRAVGVILVLAFLVGPTLAARFWTHRMKTLIFLSAVIGCLASIVGVALSRHILSVYQIPLSTGGLVVVLIGLSFLISYLVQPISKKLRIPIK